MDEYFAGIPSSKGILACTIFDLAKETLAFCFQFMVIKSCHVAYIGYTGFFPRVLFNRNNSLNQVALLFFP